MGSDVACARAPLCPLWVVWVVSVVWPCGLPVGCRLQGLPMTFHTFSPKFPGASPAGASFGFHSQRSSPEPLRVHPLPSRGPLRVPSLSVQHHTLKTLLSTTHPPPPPCLSLRPCPSSSSWSTLTSAASSVCCIQPARPKPGLLADSGLADRSHDSLGCCHRLQPDLLEVGSLVKPWDAATRMLTIASLSSIVARRGSRLHRLLGPRPSTV